MDVRLVRPEDWKELRAVRLAALEDAPDAFSATFADAVDRSEDYWRGWILGEGWDAEVRTWVADDHGRFRGMAAGSRSDADRSILDLYGMWVEPALRGSGIASRLVGMVEAWGRGLAVDRIVLWVTDGNARAEAFYAKLGYVRTDHPASVLREGSPVRIHQVARALT